MNLYLKAGELLEQGIPFAMATIIAAKGSTPRSTAKMITKSSGEIYGTIGGGLVESFVINEAVAAIREKRSRVVEYELQKDAPGGIQMQCGGMMTVFIDVVYPSPRIVMIGGGHVGLAVAKLVDLLGYRLVIVDDRQEFASQDRYPSAVEIHSDPDINRAIAPIKFDADTYIVIATKDVDYDALKSVAEADIAYIGMIGSKRKVNLIMQELREQGVSDAWLQAVHAPVGLDIGAETPEEIALSIMAEILKVRNGKTGASLRDGTRDMGT